MVERKVKLTLLVILIVLKRTLHLFRITRLKKGEYIYIYIYIYLPKLWLYHFILKARHRNVYVTMPP